MIESLPIVRLQVQRHPLKDGPAPFRWYNPAALLPVAAIAVGPRGVHGLTDDGPVIDVHHRDHPRSRDAKGRAGITVMATGDYEAIRERYGDHLVDGVAGETILVDDPNGLAGRDLPGRVTVQTADGNLLLTDFRVADPCMEFSRFCLQRPHTDPIDDEIKSAFAHLNHGSRGYRAIAGGPATIRVGDTLLLDG